VVFKTIISRTSSLSRMTTFDPFHSSAKHPGPLCWIF